MADFTIPGTWEESGSTGSSQIVYVDTADHSVAENSHHLFDRVVPVLVNGEWSTPSFRYRHRRTMLDGDGVPITGVPLIDVKIRWPYAGSSFVAGATVLKTMISDASGVLADVEFASDVIDSLRLPR
jgi:hypothetical protein